MLCLDLPRDQVILKTESICQWKPFWIPTCDTFQNAYLEEWQRVDDVQRCDPVEDNVRTHFGTTESAKLFKSGVNDVTFKFEQTWDAPSSPKSSWQAVGGPDAPTWKLSGTQGTSAFWETSGVPLLPKKHVCNYIHPKQYGPFPDRLKLPYSDEEILSGYEEDVSSIRDGFTAWVKTEFATILERHTGDNRKVNAVFREASARKHVTSCQEYHFNKDVPNRSPVQKRLSIYNWKPGPRRGKEGAIEKQIAGKWHTITLQEAIEYVDHELLTNRFHVTHYGGCAVLFNKDTFFPNIKVKSINLRDTRHDLPDKVFEGESGWVIQGVISRACFRRQPHGSPFFTVMSHIKNNYAKKRGIGKRLLLTIRAVMLEEQVDLVAGDFNGAAWRRTTNANNISIIEEAFADCDLPTPPGPTPLWGLGAVPSTWSDVCVGFSSLRTLMNAGKYGSTVHSPFTMTLVASDKPTRAAITRYGFAWTLWRCIAKDTNDDSS